MKRHPDCEKECQQAVDYGVWPERSCSPKCVWLSREETRDAIGETIARIVHRQQSPDAPPVPQEDAHPSTGGMPREQVR